MRSLVRQLCTLLAATSSALDVINLRCQEGQQPTTDALLSIFQQMLGDFRQKFIILDALDECTDCKRLLGLIEQIIGWKFGDLHILVTSRKEKEIEEAVTPWVTGQIDLQSTLVDVDIQTYLRERIREDRNLRKWSVAVRSEIEVTLQDRANGMYESTTSSLKQHRIETDHDLLGFDGWCANWMSWEHV